MGINDYLQKIRVGPAEAARQIGISRQSLYHVRIGKPAGRKVARKIVAWSNGRLKEAAILMGQAA